MPTTDEHETACSLLMDKKIGEVSSKFWKIIGPLVLIVGGCFVTGAFLIAAKAENLTVDNLKTELHNIEKKQLDRMGKLEGIANSIAISVKAQKEATEKYMKRLDQEVQKLDESINDHIKDNH